MTPEAAKKVIIVFRPHARNEDCAGVAYDKDGNVIAYHISSTVDWFRSDMGLTGKTGIGKSKLALYAAQYPDGYQLEEFIGDWRTHPKLKEFDNKSA